MRTTFTILAVLATAVLAGCGGGGGDNQANDYALGVQRAQFAFANAFEKQTNQLLKTTKPGATAKTLRAAASAVDEDVAQLQALTSTAPDKVKGLHKRLIGVMSTYSDKLNRAAKLIGPGDPRQFLTAKKTVQLASKQVEESFNNIIRQINTALS